MNWSDKVKKHTKNLPREGLMSRAVCEYYEDIWKLKSDDPILEWAVKLGKRCYEKVSKSEGEVSVS